MRAGESVTLRGMIHGSCGRINWGNTQTASYSQLNICPFRPAQGACSVQQPNPHNQLNASRIPCCAWRAVRPAVKKVHIVFMTHFDLSCTDRRAVICANYFNVFMPLYSTTAKELRARADPSGAQLRYTTWPWLIEEFFNSSASCADAAGRPNATTRALVRQAIADDDIIWQGKSLNLQPELCDASTYDYSLSEAERLNTRFGKSWGRAAAKSADVAGFSRAVVPPLAKRGIRFLHIGWNAACTMPALPSIFRWRVGDDELMVQAADTYGDELVLPNFDTALVFLYSVDNRPPPSADEVVAFWRATQFAYPNAELLLSSLDDYAEELWAQRETLDIPVVTQEMGDSWLNLVGSDPYKVQAFRGIQRLLNHSIESGTLQREDRTLQAYLHRLLSVSEHNQGFGTQHYPNNMFTENGNWSNAEFDAVRSRADYRFLESSWTVGRDYLFPLSLLNTSAPAPTIPPSDGWLKFEAAVSNLLTHELVAKRPNVSAPGFSKLPASVWLKEQRCGEWRLQMNSSGALESLRHGANGRELGPAAVYRYQTFTEEDNGVFDAKYLWGSEHHGEFADTGIISKRGSDSAKPSSSSTMPTLEGLARQETGTGCTFVSSLSLPDQLHTKYGAPTQLFLKLSLPKHALTPASSADTTEMKPTAVETAAVANLEFSWFDKSATRLSEASWLSFAPSSVQNHSLWSMDVMGHPVSPLDVVVNGTRHLHAVGCGLAHPEGILIDTLDAALVVPGQLHWMDWAGEIQPDLSEGFHFSLHENAWNSATPNWLPFEDGRPGRDMLFRFQLSASPSLRSTPPTRADADALLDGGPEVALGEQRPCCDCAGEPLIDKETNLSIGVFHWCPWGAGRYKGCHPPPRDPSLPDPAYSCNGSIKGGGVVKAKAECPTPCLPPRVPPLPRPPTPPPPKPSTNKKRGVCLAPHGNKTHCDDLRALSSGSTWYTNWGEADTLWHNVGCPARPSVKGFEYVPQIWGKGHLDWVNESFPNLNATLLREATYLLGFNEPDQYSQSHVSPGEAAGLWPNMTWIAQEYSLKLVAPCVSNVHGAKWWLDAFDENCTARYGKPCEFDYPCAHAYYFPEPCNGLPAWACASSMMNDLESLSKRYGGKPVWVTEWACPAWIGGTFAKNNASDVQYCNATNQLRTMQQMLPKLDAAEYVFRYSWYVSRDGDMVYNNGPGSPVRLKANNSLLSPEDFPFYPSSLTPLGEAYASIVIGGGA